MFFSNHFIFVIMFIDTSLICLKQLKKENDENQKHMNH